MSTDAVVSRIDTFVVKVPPRRAAPETDRLNIAGNGVTLATHFPDALLVRVEASDGAVGWGEALAPVAAAVPARIIDDMLAPHVLGASIITPAKVTRGLAGLMRERGHLGGHQADALAAVDIALWDLAGHALGAPVSAILGGPRTADVGIYVSDISGDPTTVAGLAATHYQQGVRSFKLHGSRDAKGIIDRFDEVRRAVPDARIAVDLHCGFSRYDALWLGRELDRRGAWFIEAPLVPEDVAGHAHLAQALDTPIAVGEAMRHRFHAQRYLEAAAVDILQPDVGRTGLTEAAAIGVLAEVANVPVVPHHSVALGVALAAGLHLAASVGSPAFEYISALPFRANRILREPLPTPQDGVLTMPSGDGLGVTVDDEVVRTISGKLSQPRQQQ